MNCPHCGHNLVSSVMPLNVPYGPLPNHSLMYGNMGTAACNPSTYHVVNFGGNNAAAANIAGCVPNTWQSAYVMVNGQPYPSPQI